MREIKFRGKRTDNGKVVYGDLIHGVNHKAGKMYILPIVGGVQSMSGGADPLDGYNVIPETVGQYTGLKDRNGVEIYEGDILRKDNGGLPENNHSKVVFHQGAFMASQRVQLSDRSIYSHGYEVIGNIHENPELLNPNEI